ncbi:J domain-containing protein [Nostoc sp. FACHB-892]|uniref:J domain-containing protein n=1 Tax=Nostoc sp. FACHB-892 TaxID=2692843 RepID=UPI001683CDCF|nr:J domain-containing protein [Nostoc sp. FACHB-892]MBD2731707.1 J domain-containing protein [Nostoc sp. FACHB-892]
MPRKTTVPSQSIKVTPLALSQLHIRLEFLEKEHQSLLKQIKRKRTELKNFVEQMRSFGTEFLNKANPSFRKMAELDQEIHALFEEIFTTRKFGKQTLKNIQAVYRNLQVTGAISLKPNSQQLDTLDESFGNEDSQSDFSKETSEQQHQYWQGQQCVDSASVIRTDDQRKIRQTFLKLAEIFHPDKARDSETQKSHTEIMKEINKAYQEGDLARLLEIEQSQQPLEIIDNNNEDDLTRRCRTLEQHNQILLAQYEKLKQELRLTKNTPEGTMVCDSRKAAKEGIDAMAAIVETMESQINVVSGIRDFVKDFREQKITIKEFLAGPTPLHSLDEETIEDILEQMLSELMR